MSSFCYAFLAWVVHTTPNLALHSSGLTGKENFMAKYYLLLSKFHRVLNVNKIGVLIPFPLHSIPNVFNSTSALYLYISYTSFTQLATCSTLPKQKQEN